MKNLIDKINVEALEAIALKFDEINRCIELGIEVPEELTKNFITFPLVDDPYSEL